MSKRTIRILDEYCRAANTASSVVSSTGYRDQLLTVADGKRDRQWALAVASIEAEITRWSSRRDKYIAKVRTLLDETDEKDRAHLIKYSRTLGDDLAVLGIRCSWLPSKLKPWE